MGLDHFLIEKGVHVIPDWAQQWQEAATSAVPGFVQKSVSAKQELLYQEVLRSNLHLIGRQALPADLQAWHKRQLQGLFVLQADETINVAAAAKYRYQKSALHFGCVDIHQMRRNLPKSCRYEEAAEKRCLKLMLTDGATQVVGLEYRRIPGLALHMPAGAKIAVKDVMIRRGILLLTPGNTVMLGGQVDDLEAARQKTLKRWNQPASGRTSRNEAGPVDLYAEAAAAAWHAEGGSASASAPGVLPGPASVSAPNASSALHPSRSQTAAPRAGDAPATDQTLPYRPVPSAPRPAAHARLAQARSPFTPPNQPHQQVQAAALQPNHPAASAHAGSEAADGAAHLQSTVNGGQSTSMTTRGSGSAAKQSNQLSGQSALPAVTLNGTSAAQRAFAADNCPQLPRSRLALSRATVPSQGPQQASGQPEVPPQPSHTPPGATMRVTPNQPQQDLIVIDDSPQLPNAYQPPHDLSEALCDDMADAHDAVAATQPGKRQRHQLLDSSSDSDDEAAPLKAARTASGSGTRQASEHAHSGQAVEGANNGTDDHSSIGRFHGGLANDIIPDSSADVGGMPEPYEDYGNEVVFEEDYEASLHDPAECEDDDTDWAGQEPLHASHSLASHATGRAAVDSSTGSLYGSQTMEVADSPSDKRKPGEAAGSNMLDRSSDVIKATEALFNPPFTTLSNIAEYIPQMPSSEFPMTLRINGTLGSPLCTLQFKDSQGRALERYSIDMELRDATSKCTATVGHDILLQAVGITPAVFCAKLNAGRKPAVLPYLQQMGDYMTRYSVSAMLMDIEMCAPPAQPVIVHIHKQWTKADREAVHLQ